MTDQLFITIDASGETAHHQTIEEFDTYFRNINAQVCQLEWFYHATGTGKPVVHCYEIRKNTPSA